MPAVIHEVDSVISDSLCKTCGTNYFKKKIRIPMAYQNSQALHDTILNVYIILHKSQATDGNCKIMFRRAKS